MAPALTTSAMPRVLAANTAVSTQDKLIATVLADIALILLLGVALGGLARRLGQPRVLGEIVAGIMIGPSLLGLLPGHLTEHFFPVAARPYLAAISQLGLLLFMFSTGWEFDLDILRHGKTRSTAMLVSAGSVGIAFGGGVLLAGALYSRHSTVRGHHIAFLPFGLFLGAAMSITAFPVLASVLRERRLLRWRIGVTALASAAVDDMIAWCVLALVAAIASSHSPWQFARVAGLSVAYVALMALVVRPLLQALVCRKAAAGAQFQLFVVLAAGILLSSYATTWVGIHSIFGAFAFGMAMPRKPLANLDEQLQKPLDLLGSLLLPVFFIVTGLSVDVRTLSGRGLLELVAVIAVACIGKLIGTVAAARVFGAPWRETAALGVLMNMRGLTELVILNVGVGLGVLDPAIYTAMVIMAVTTTALAAPVLNRLSFGAPEHERDPEREPEHIGLTSDLSIGTMS